MVALPLALTATYEPPADMGEYAHVVIYMNGQPLLRIVSDDPVAKSHLREQRAIETAVRDTLSRLTECNDDVEVMWI